MSINIPFICCFLLFIPCSQAQDLFQLATPFLQYDAMFFDKETSVTIKFDQANTNIHYTLNNQQPTENDPLYTQPIAIKKHGTVLKARVFSDGFLPSETVSAHFFEQGKPIQSIKYPPPHQRYPGEGERTLIDSKGGNPLFSHKTWLGYQRDTVIFDLSLAHPEKINQLMVDLLSNQGAWIFLPQKIILYGQKKSDGTWISMGETNLDPPQKTSGSACRPVTVTPKKRFKTDRMRLVIIPLAAIPDWHPGKGTPSWLFIDEIKLY